VFRNYSMGGENITKIPVLFEVTAVSETKDINLSIPTNYAVMDDNRIVLNIIEIQ